MNETQVDYFFNSFFKFIWYLPDIIYKCPYQNSSNQENNTVLKMVLSANFDEVRSKTNNFLI